MRPQGSRSRSGGRSRLEVLEKVPQGLSMYRFVNVQSRFGELLSCVIAGDEAEVFGSMRAFWWALARTNVWQACYQLTKVRMSKAALSQVHNSARTIFDVAVKESGGVEYMRDQILP